MRALVLNGALAGDQGLAPIESALGSTLSARGWAVERIQLRDVFIASCKGCFDCWVKTPGVCATKDGAGAITRALVRSDLVVLLSPITFGGYSSELKKALDRSIGIVSPFFTRLDGEVHHKPRYTCYPAWLAIGVSGDRDSDEAQIFARLVARNAVNVHAPAQGHPVPPAAIAQLARRMMPARVTSASAFIPPPPFAAAPLRRPRVARP